MKMYRAPEILYSLSKEELIAKLNAESASIELYGCPSGKTYSDCHNS